MPTSSSLLSRCSHSASTRAGSGSSRQSPGQTASASPRRIPGLTPASAAFAVTGPITFSLLGSGSSASGRSRSSSRPARTARNSKPGMRRQAIIGNICSTRTSVRLQGLRDSLEGPGIASTGRNLGEGAALSPSRECDRLKPNRRWPLNVVSECRPELLDEPLPRNYVPVRESEVCAAEGVRWLLIGFDQGDLSHEVAVLERHDIASREISSREADSFDFESLGPSVAESLRFRFVPERCCQNKSDVSWRPRLKKIVSMIIGNESTSTTITEGAVEHHGVLDGPYRQRLVVPNAESGYLSLNGAA